MLPTYKCTCRFEMATPVKELNIAMDAPPNTGYGIVINTADSLPTIPNKINTIAQHKKTCRLAT